MKHFAVIILCFSSFSTFTQSLVIPGDFPDPSVIRYADEYWATATTSNWAPTFPLYTSKDLATWTLTGYTFNTLPDWADYFFWAPEISYDRGKVYLYYSAHKRNGGLCVGVASARTPAGPFTDHGPIMCEEAGSIDAFAVRDEKGKLFLIWKEDGNSVGKPTPIWAMEMNEERTALLGEKTELFRNDAPWEANLVEGVSIINKGGYFYAFYSGAGCCGRGCSYGLGVARSRNLLGPWEKFNKNPLLVSNFEWKCPGHGTPVEKDGKYYLLYHAYQTEGDVYVGRQGVITEFIFTSEGWISFLPSEKKKNIIPEITEDSFAGDTLASSWQWSVFSTPQHKVENGALTLEASSKTGVSFVAQKAVTNNYEAQTSIIPIHTKAEAGIALIGDENNLIYASYKDNLIRVWKVEEGKETIIVEHKIKPAKAFLKLKVRFNGADNVVFSYATANSFSPLNLPISGFFLPPWDRAVRIALVAKGKTGESATFDNFILKNK